MIGEASGPVQLHASCIALEGSAILLRGPAGSGKSDLALRLVDAGALLVADDLCEIRRAGDCLLAGLPAAAEARFRGRIEVRGIGILALPYAGPTRLAMVVDLSAGQLERQPPAREAVYLGIGLPLIVLDPFQASAAAKLRLLAKVGPRSIMRAP